MGRYSFTCCKVIIARNDAVLWSKAFLDNGSPVSSISQSVFSMKTETNALAILSLLQSQKHDDYNVAAPEDDTLAHAARSVAQHAAAAALRLHPLRRFPGAPQRVDVLCLLALRDDMALLPLSLASSTAPILS